MSRSRGWCFTVNNYTWDDENWALTLHWTMEEGQKPMVKYVVCGKEVGEQGTPHLQGYIWFTSLKSLSQVKEIHPTAHWETAIADALKNKEYCTKDEDYFEWGIPPLSSDEKGILGGEAEKERWADALDNCKKGNYEEIPADIRIKYEKNLDYIRKKYQIVPECLDGELNNYWYYGPPRTGKTKKAFGENPGAYLKGLNKWWDGYVNQEAVIIDDMDPYHKSLAQDFKQWAHHYAFPAETKGGILTIRPKKIIVTSNYSINEIWEDEVTRAAIKARFKVVEFEYNEEFPAPPLPPYPMFVKTFNKP